ncbi:MAG: hypothetical protein WB699_13550 [Bacteroidota bacterium]
MCQSRLAPIQRRALSWRAAFILFLVALVPLTPILAQVQGDQSMAVAGAAPGGVDIALHPVSHPALIPPSTGENLQFSRQWQVLFLLEGTGVTDQDPCTVGRTDANEEETGTLWFILGLLTGPCGVGAAYLVSPSPLQERLMGKSKPFVSAYAECYGDVARDIHTKWAWIGFGTLVGMLLVVALLALVSFGPGNGKIGD